VYTHAGRLCFEIGLLTIIIPRLTVSKVSFILARHRAPLVLTVIAKGQRSILFPVC